MQQVFSFQVESIRTSICPLRIHSTLVSFLWKNLSSQRQPQKTSQNARDDETRAGRSLEALCKVSCFWVDFWVPPRYFSNRRPPADIPHDAIIVRGGSSQIFTPPSRNRKKKYGLGETATVWVEKIKRGEILAQASLVERVSCLCGVSVEGVILRSPLIGVTSTYSLFKPPIQQQINQFNDSLSIFLIQQKLINSHFIPPPFTQFNVFRWNAYPTYSKTQRRTHSRCPRYSLKPAHSPSKSMTVHCAKRRSCPDWSVLITWTWLIQLIVSTEHSIVRQVVFSDFEFTVPYSRPVSNRSPIKNHLTNTKAITRRFETSLQQTNSHCQSQKSSCLTFQTTKLKMTKAKCQQLPINDMSSFGEWYLSCFSICYHSNTIRVHSSLSIQSKLTLLLFVPLLKINKTHLYFCPLNV